MTGFAAVILAAGQGTRMKSSLPKVLHPVAGLPMILWSVQNARTLGADSIALVIGVGAEAVQQTVGDQFLSVQQERLGTGHATPTGKELLQARRIGVGIIGDMPTLAWRRCGSRAVAPDAALVNHLERLSDDSMGFGRVVVPRRAVTANVEERSLPRNLA